MLSSLFLTNAYRIRHITPNLRLLLPGELRLWKTQNRQEESAGFPYLYNERFDFSRVTKMTFDRTSPEELRRIMGLAPNLKSVYNFNKSTAAWLLR